VGAPALDPHHEGPAFQAFPIHLPHALGGVLEVLPGQLVHQQNELGAGNALQGVDHLLRQVRIRPIVFPTLLLRHRVAVRHENIDPVPARANSNALIQLPHDATDVAPHLPQLLAAHRIGLDRHLRRDLDEVMDHGQHCARRR